MNSQILTLLGSLSFGSYLSTGSYDLLLLIHILKQKVLHFYRDIFEWQPNYWSFLCDKAFITWKTIENFIFKEQGSLPNQIVFPKLGYFAKVFPPCPSTNKDKYLPLPASRFQKRARE